MRRTTTRAGAALALAAALVLGGCTLSGSEPEPTGGGEAVATPSSAPRGSEPAEPEGASPEEISSDLLEQAAADLPAPVGGQTVGVTDNANNPVQVTVEVVALARTRDATHLTLQLSSDETVGGLNLTAFTDRGVPNREFFDRFALQDSANGVRHYPLSWLRPGASEDAPPDGPPNSCLCPYRGQTFTLSPEPLVMDVLYGPLPEDVSTVDLVAPGGLSIPGLAVSAATR